jgi:hypothetical protein
MQLSTVVDTVSQYIFFVNMDEIMDIHDIHTRIYVYTHSHIYIYIFLDFVGKLTFNIFLFFIFSISFRRPSARTRRYPCSLDLS